MYADHLVQVEKDRIQAEADAELKRVFERKNAADEVFARMKTQQAKQLASDAPNTAEVVYVY